MQKRRIAANRVYTAPQTHWNNHVVELENGYVTSIYPLNGEQAMTEWLGGIIVVTSLQTTNLNSIRSIDDFYTDPNGQNNPSVAYHISNIPVQSHEWKGNRPVTRIA
ncbi:MAG: hypothetical protein IJT97_04675 [Bacteroidaceae bacterium]|nr:hypothetical protein [Bacteroidaceae bacterium]